MGTTINSVETILAGERRSRENAEALAQGATAEEISAAALKRIAIELPLLTGYLGAIRAEIFNAVNSKK